MPALHLRRSVPKGFTLVEALVSITLAAMAGSVLLLGINASVNTTDDAMRETIALGMAQQLLDEILGNHYMEPGTSPTNVYLGPEAGESERETFDDLDDYRGYSSRPPVDLFGVPLGSDDGQGGQRHVNFRAPGRSFERWQQQVSVAYVDPANPGTALPSGQTRLFRAVEVRIVDVDPVRGPRTLAQLRRVIAHVPPLP